MRSCTKANARALENRFLFVVHPKSFLQPSTVRSTISRDSLITAV